MNLTKKTRCCCHSLRTLLIAGVALTSVIAGASAQAGELPTCIDTITFEGYPAGTILTTVFSDNGTGPIGVRAERQSSTLNRAVIFDSANPTGNDLDLGTPNEDFGGPGIGVGGESGAPFENNRALGNVFIVATNLTDANSDGLVDDPNDHNGTCWMRFDFSTIGPVTIVGVDAIIDSENGPVPTAEFFDSNDVSLGAFALPRTGNNGVASVNFGAIPNVAKMMVSLNASGAIDGIQFIPPGGSSCGGACCTDGSCEVISALACELRGGRFLGNDTTCEQDSDSDGTLDACDGCPEDPAKTEAGLCGCGRVDLDCNSNSVCDSDEVGEGSGSDCNSNDIPDDCETDSDSDGTIDDCDRCPADPAKTRPGLCGCGNPDLDCNTNGICDADETGNDSSEDCNSNTIPDECETDSDHDGAIDDCDGCPEDGKKTSPGLCGCGNSDQDCNTNGVCDSADISGGTSADCSTNGIPDECESDSDSDGTIDDCDGCPEDAEKTAPGICGCGNEDVDCNTNGVCDTSEIEGASGGDCNTNNIPDECETDTDGDGTIDDCDQCPNDAEKTEPGLCGCGNPDLDCNTNGVCDADDVQGNGEEGPFSQDCNTNLIPDECEADTDGDGTIDACDECPTNPNRVVPGPCGCSDEEADCNTNGLCDGTEILEGSSQDCDTNQVPDECQPDSDSDGTIDPCDECPEDPSKTVAGVCGCSREDVDCNTNGICDTDEVGGKGSSEDCNTNQIPDECETDTDGDDTIDDCDGCPTNPEMTSPDGDCGCNTSDCNTNKVCDGRDIAMGTSQDCDSDVVPDECETDSDTDDVIDDCDACPEDANKSVSSGLCGCGSEDADCNANEACDAADIESGASGDCDTNGVPDECQDDTDEDGTIDPCDQCPENAAKITAGLCGCNAVEADCNGNEVCDSADIESGASDDCNTNGIPDDCESDTDGDGTINPCDQCPQDASKTAPGLCGCGKADLDCNTNGVCDTADIASGASKDCNTNGIPDECEPDSDGDGVINACDACPSQAGTQANGCPTPPGPQPTPGACILGNGNCIITIEGDCVAQDGDFQGAGTTCPEPPGPQPAPPCDPTTGGLNIMFSLLFHAPVCGGCPVMVAGTMFFLMMFRAGYRRRGGRR